TRCAIGVALHGEIRDRNYPQRRFAGKEFAARFLRGETAGETRHASGAGARVDEFLCTEKQGKLLGCSVLEQPLDPGELDGIQAATRALRRFHFHRSLVASARTSKATFMPPKPRHRTSARSLRGRCGAREAGKEPNSGSSEFKVGTPGTIPSRSAFRANTRSSRPDAAIKWPKAHLNPVTGGGLAPNTRRRARTSDASEARVPLPWATIRPMAEAGTPASANAISMARLKPSPSGRTSTIPLASVVQPKPRNSPRMAARRAWASSTVSSMTAAAPSPKTVPLRS